MSQLIHYAECRSSECRYAECRGAHKTSYDNSYGWVCLIMKDIMLLRADCLYLRRPAVIFIAMNFLNTHFEQLEFKFEMHKAPLAGLLNKSSCLAPALGVTKFIIVADMIWVTLYCHT